MVLEARNPRSRCLQVGFFWGLSLAHRRPPSCCVVTWSFLGTNTHVCFLTSSYKKASHSELGPAHVMSFYLYSPFIGPYLQMHSHIKKHLGVIPHIEFGETQLSSEQNLYNFIIHFLNGISNLSPVKIICTDHCGQSYKHLM